MCDQCDEGFHGNPPAVPCMSCECNGNIDPSVPGSCNASTGECLICTNNATGQQCEQCVEGFYGNASAQECQCECVFAYTCEGVGGRCLCVWCSLPALLYSLHVLYCPCSIQYVLHCTHMHFYRSYSYFSRPSPSPLHTPFRPSHLPPMHLSV